MTGNGQLDSFEKLFSFLRSVQNLLVPSILSTTTIERLQGDHDGHIMFATNISFTALSTIRCFTKGVLYSVNFIGGWLPVSIHIIIVLVFPKSVSLFLQRGLHFILFNP